MKAELLTLVQTPLGSWGVVFLGVSLVLLSVLILLAIRGKKGGALYLQKALTENADATKQALAATVSQQNGQLRMELDAKINHLTSTQQKSLLDFARLVQQMNAQVATQEVQNRQATMEQMSQLTGSLTKELGDIRTTLQAQLQSLQQSNDQRLAEMRATVEEKLQSTLQSRLSESFSQVASQLKEVESGLGEMRALAGKVGELKRVLTNVKTRGTFGEVQLKGILDEVIPGRFEENVPTVPNSNERVEFAIKLPGAGDMPQIWLPIDAKFPVEDYLKIEEARDVGNTAEAERHEKALDARLKLEAKKIHEKYVRAPFTTEFAILFLPSESLYAECLRRTGVIEELQQRYRVTVAGPTVLAALLNSLQMGFQTLAIQERSAQVWAILGNVKTEFAKFAQVMDSMEKQIETMKNTVERVKVRTNMMGRELKSVEEGIGLKDEAPELLQALEEKN